MQTLVPPAESVLKRLLEQFKPCFTKPQFRNFSTYTLGLVASEGKKNINAINRSFTDAKNQSSLNRFLTSSPWSLQRLEAKRLTLAREKLPFTEGSTGFLLVDDTINRKTGKHMEDAGYHYDGAEGKPVWGHDLVTTHYVNGDAEYPVRLGLYVKKEACHKKGSVFKTKIQLACEQIAAFKPPAGTETVVAFDSWFFCRQVTEAAEAGGYSWVTQAESNRVVYIKGRKMNVTQLAQSLPEKRFKTVKVGGEAYVLCGLRAWMPRAGDVKLVVSRAEDGFHFIVSNRLEWTDRRVVEAYRVRQGIDVFYRDVKQNLGLEEYQMRGGRGAIIHWHLVFTAYTLLALLRRSLRGTMGRLGWVLDTLGGVCRWVKCQCFRRLVDWIYLKFRHQTKPETIYRMLKI
ncbi:MAG: IS701 family transposase [Deltaproteobacteria bacterium]|nr:IS701 family transposase [Deltaproteobacteria bacterium]